MKTTTRTLVGWLISAIVAPALCVGQEDPDDTIRQVLAGELPAGAEVIEIEAVDLVDGPLRIDVFSPAFSPWVRIFEQGSSTEGSPIGGGIALSPSEPAVMGLESVPGVRYRIEIRPLYGSWGGPYEITIRNRDHDLPQASTGASERLNQIREYAESHADPILEARTALANELPAIFVEESSVPELMSRFPSNQLLGLWDPRWQRIRWQYDQIESSLESRRKADELLELFQSKLGDDHPAVVATELRLAQALWQAGAVIEARQRIDSARSRLERSVGKGHPLSALAELSKGRWLRKTGSLIEARPCLEEASSGFKSQLGDRSLAIADVLEESGALEWDRGDFEAAVTRLTHSVEVREENVGRFDTSLLSGLKILGIAQIAQAVTALATEPLNEEEAITGDDRPKERKEKVKKRDLEPQPVQTIAVAETVFPRIIELSRTPNLTLQRLDRAWALSILAATSTDGAYTEEFESELHWADYQLELTGSYPPMKRRADHASSWAPTLYMEAQDLYARAVASSLSRDAVRDRAQSLMRQGELRDSKELLTRVVAAAEEDLGPDHLETALARAELASQQWRSGGSLADIAEAIQQSVETLQVLLGSKSVPVNLMRTDLALLKADMGLYEEAVVLARETRANLTLQLAEISPVRSRYFPRLAWTFREAGNLQEMEATLLAALPDGSLTLCTALHLNRNLMLADLRMREGDLAAARSLVKGEVDLCGNQGALGKNLTPLTDILDEDYEAREGRRKAKGLDDLHNKGKKRRKKLLLWGGIFIVAAPVAFAAATAATLGAAMGAGGAGAAGMSGMASLILIEGMALTAAASPFMMAKGAADPNYKLAPVVDPVRESSYYDVVGAVLQESGYYSEAAALHRGAIKGMERGAAKGHPKLAGLYADLGEVLWDSSGREKGGIAETDQKLAREAAEDSAEILDDFLHEALSVLPEQQALKLVSSRPRPESILFSGVLHAAGSKDPWLDAAWNWTLRKRSLVLDELAFRHQEALETQSAETAQAWEEFVEARRRVATLWVRGPQTGYTHWPELYEAIEERKQAEKALTAVSAGFRSPVAYQDVDLGDVASALPKGSALVEFVRVPIRPPGPSTYVDHYVALIVDSQRGMFDANLGPAAEIDSLVQEWLQELRDAYTRSVAEGGPGARLDESPGAELRVKVWDPIIRQVPEVDRLFVVLDGALNQVNLPALPTGDGGYVIDRKPGVHLLSSGRDLVRIQKETNKPNTGMLALGNPDFDLAEATDESDPVSGPVYRGPQARCGVLQRHRWRALPETEIEVEEIAALYEEHADVTLYTGAAATEYHLKRMAPGKRYLHIATHGFFLQDECPAAGGSDRGIGLLVTESTVEIGPSDEVTETSSALAFGDNPLLLSGLVLAGANNTDVVAQDGEDGIATAEELAALDLRGLEIAALSACDTGRGTVAAGEGVFGLRRALEIAGARTVLMSLWPVPDEAGRKWMTQFYKRKFDGESVQQATRETSLELLHELRREGKSTHPYLWAGFVAAGDWR